MPPISAGRARETGASENGLEGKRANGAAEPLGAFAASRKKWTPPKQSLTPVESVALRDQLLGEVRALADQSQATVWAQKAMAAKNTLTTADCGVVEPAFAARAAALAEDGAPAETSPLAAEVTPGRNGDGHQSTSSSPVHSEDVAGGFGPPGRVNNAVAWHVDKGALTFSEPRRYRDRAHLRFVSAQPCLVCGRRPSDAHHLRFAQPRALGRRVSDEYAVPLCRSHHRALHRHGDEAAWWETNRVDPVVVARELWQRTRLDGPRGGRVEALLSVGVIEGAGGAAETGRAHVSSDQPAQAPRSAGQ
jgi:hypothetical protein